MSDIVFIKKICIQACFNGTNLKKKVFKKIAETSLVVEWVRIHLPMQVRSLVPEYFACLGATKPMHCNSETHKPQLLSLYDASTEACAPRAFSLQQEKPLQ